MADDQPPWRTRTWNTIRKRPDPLTSIAFTVPLFLVYHLGILLVDRRIDLDFVSSWVQGLLQESVPAYAAVTVVFALLLLAMVAIQRKRGAVQPSSLWRVLFEAFAYSVLLLVAMGWATHKVLRSGDTMGLASLNLFEKVVLAAGAGFYEEFIFRALLVSGGAAVIGRIFRVSARGALLIAMVGSSILFALAHNVGVMGEPFQLDIAGYRMLEGMFFAMLYVARGFATVAYTHAFYESLAYFLYT